MTPSDFMVALCKSLVRSGGPYFLGANNPPSIRNDAPITRDRNVADVRAALAVIGVGVVDVIKTKNYYVNYWFDLDGVDFVLRTAPARGGGIVLLIDKREAMVEAQRTSTIVADAAAHKKALIESARSKLTEEERRAVGI